MRSDQCLRSSEKHLREKNTGTKIEKKHSLHIHTRYVSNDDIKKRRKKKNNCKLLAVYRLTRKIQIIRLEWPDISSWGAAKTSSEVNDERRQQQRLNTVHRDRGGGVKERREDRDQGVGEQRDQRDQGVGVQGD